MNRRRVFNICLSVLITAAFALLAVFVFSDSYLRFGEAVKDFGLSVGYYFCTLFGIEYNIVPSVTEYSSVMDWSILLPSVRGKASEPFSSDVCATNLDDLSNSELFFALDTSPVGSREPKLSSRLLNTPFFARPKVGYPETKQKDSSFLCRYR